MQQYDVVVLGGGPGGYVAAIRGAQLGMKVAVVEREHLGGICLNWGCIPTKSLLRSSEVAQLMKHAKDFGFEDVNVKPNTKEMVKRSRKISEQLAGGVGMLLKKNKVDVIWGEGTFKDKNTLTVTHEEKTTDVKAKHIIIATGARARPLPGFEVSKNIWSYREAMVPEALPKSLLVIGSGAIGVEFASFYNALGVDVTIVELQKNILPAEDEEIAKFARKQFEKHGIKILSESTSNFVKETSNGVEVTIKTPKGEEKKTFEKVITAIGVVPNIENIGLEKAGVTLNDKHLKLNEYCQTTASNIYAIGDVASAPWLAHKASHEGVMVMEHISGKKVHPVKPEDVPGCTYSNPQIASIGLTEKQAAEKGLPIKVGRFMGVGNGKALALGEPDALFKTIFHKETGELLGAHLVGAEVTELIQGFALAKKLEATEEDIMHTIFPHPTLSEMMHESVLDAFGAALHK